MHLLFITHEYPTKDLSNGGLGTMVYFVANAFAQKGIKVTVVGFYKNAYNESHYNNYLEIKRLPIPTRRPRFWEVYKSLTKKIATIHKATPIDAIEGPEMAFAFLSIPNGIKKVIRLNGGHHFFTEIEPGSRKWHFAWLEKRSFRKADAFIAVSRYVGETTQKLLGIDFPFVVIHNPVDVQQFSEADENDIVPGRIVFVGTLTEKKGIRQLVGAMPKIRAAIPSAHLYAVGRDSNIRPSGKSYRSILDDSMTEEMKKYITFAGSLPHHKVSEAIKTAEVCVYPSHMEALPLAWLEALSMAKPFVGGQTGPGPEVVKHKETGLLCDPFSPIDIAEKTIWLLQQKEFSKILGQNARKDILKRFDIRNVINENELFYRSLIFQDS